jgi:hypothetical protein
VDSRAEEIIYDVSHLPTGMYLIRIGDEIKKFRKIR